MRDNIENLFKQIDKENKKALIITLAEYWKMSPTSIETNWFSRFGIIPELKQKDTLTIIQRAVNIQNTKKARYAHN
jgi:hypothetical protein